MSHYQLEPLCDCGARRRRGFLDARHGVCVERERNRRKWIWNERQHLFRSALSQQFVVRIHLILRNMRRFDRILKEVVCQPGSKISKMELDWNTISPSGPNPRNQNGSIATEPPDERSIAASTRWSAVFAQAGADFSIKCSEKMDIIISML